MKAEFEQQEIEIIAQRVAQLLEPMLSRLNKGDTADNQIFTVDALAKYLKVESTWIYKQVSLKTLPYFKNGKYVRFRKRDVDQWIETQTVKPIPPLKIRRN